MACRNTGNNKMTFKVGDKVKLLDDLFGYKQGDIATIIRITKEGCVVEVKGRESLSSLKPYVWYDYDDIKLCGDVQTKIK